MGWFRRTPRESEIQRRLREHGLHEGDLLVARHLVANGADLAEPRHVLHFLYFPDDRAEHAAADATGNGWEVTVAPPDGDVPTWSVVCERMDVVLEPDGVRDTRLWFEALADEHGGTYDGWEASA